MKVANDLDLDRIVKTLTMRHIAIGKTYEALAVCIAVMRDDPVAFRDEIRYLGMLSAIIYTGILDRLIIEADAKLKSMGE